MRARSLCLLLASFSFASVEAAMTIDRLRCEYAENPIGVDTAIPRLGWTLVDARRGQIQTAYRVLVASTPEQLDSEKDLLWDSGKVSSAETLIVYAGAQLASGQRCCWRVRAWDRQGEPSAWSNTAFWQVALLSAADWTARWISPAEETALGWTDFTFAADVEIQDQAAGLAFRAQDASNLYMWQLNCALGPHLLLRPHICKNGKWSMLDPVALDSVVPDASVRRSHRVEIEVRGTTIRTRIDGRLVDEREDSTFASGTVGFRADSKENSRVDNVLVTGADGTLLLNDTFDKASAAFPKAPVVDGKLALNNATLLHRAPLSKECPRLRKTFTLDKPVLRATASVCGLGFYELYVNGRKAGDRVLAPANTPYGQRLLFDTLDVTDLVCKGDNAVGLWLAPGYSDDYSQWGWKWESSKRAIMQIDVVYRDGSAARLATDRSWLSGPSPISFASLYDGETFDAAREDPAWATTAFKAQGWQPAIELEPTRARLLPNAMPPVRVVQTLRPIAISETKPGVFVADMGQNFAGVVRIRAQGPRGARIVLRHSELLAPDGTLDPWTNRRAKAADSFALRGEGVETYEPRFTYHGFRYVEVTGYPGRPTADDITGCVVGADVRQTGTFDSSDATLNRLASNCRWSMRSNFMSIPTDCCMRDERTPCQMDSLAYEESAMGFFDMPRFYAKWLDDIEGGRGNPDWNGDQVFLPWRLYWFYNDRRALESRYDNMRAYVEHLHAKTPNHVYADGFGDWCPPNDGSWGGYHGSVTEVDTCLYAEMARLVADSASVLGKAGDDARFRTLAAEIGRAFHAQRYDAARAAYGDGRQTTAILPLAFGLVPQDQHARVFDRLLDTIRTANNGRLDTGIFGTRYLADVLCDGGAPDLALQLLTQPEYPGFGFQIAQGATTLWEQWTVKGGMNSHNHAMFADVGSSLVSRFAGITALKPGFAEIGVRPCLPSSLTFAEASQETVAGRIFSHWERVGDGITLRVSIPANASARIALPSADPALVTEGGVPVAKVPGISPLGAERAYSLYRVGSGDYLFASPKVAR